MSKAKKHNAIVIFDNVRMSKATLQAILTSMETSYKRGGGCRNKNSQYLQDMKAKIERGYKLLGQKIPNLVSRISIKNTTSTSQSNLVSSPAKADNTSLFKALAVNLHKGGEKAADALAKAAKKFNITLTKSMIKYPGSFIHAYKKSH